VALILVLLSAATAGPLTAQTFGRRPVAFGGLEFREYRFAEPFALRSLRQVAIPVGAAASRGRLSADIGGYWAATTLTNDDGGFRRVTGLTDTQVRAAYTIGRDAAVASVVLNLPTGRDRMAPADFDVLGAVSSSFLAFPVSAFANGGSLTAALAAVTQAGGWNVGLAGSLRGNRTFTPVVDSVAGPLNYRAGIEGRMRAGADRLLGSSRLSLGVTLSGFRDDIYAGLGTVRGSYQPGTRWIGEAGLAGPALGGLLSASLWGYHRAAGDTAGVSLENQELLGGLNLAGSWVIGPTIDLEPALELRFTELETGAGLLGGGGVGVRARLGRGANLMVSTRFEAGYLDLQVADEAGGTRLQRTGVKGYSLTAFLRLTP
jgi:hypothetical protein